MGPMGPNGAGLGAKKKKNCLFNGLGSDNGYRPTGRVRA